MQAAWTKFNEEEVPLIRANLKSNEASVVRDELNRFYTLTTKQHDDTELFDILGIYQSNEWIPYDEPELFHQAQQVEENLEKLLTKIYTGLKECENIPTLHAYISFVCGYSYDENCSYHDYDDYQNVYNEDSELDDDPNVSYEDHTSFQDDYDDPTMYYDHSNDRQFTHDREQETYTSDGIVRATSREFEQYSDENADGPCLESNSNSSDEHCSHHDHNHDEYNAYEDQNADHAVNNSYYDEQDSDPENINEVSQHNTIDNSNDVYNHNHNFTNNNENCQYSEFPTHNETDNHNHGDQYYLETSENPASHDNDPQYNSNRVTFYDEYDEVEHKQQHYIEQNTSHDNFTQPDDTIHCGEHNQSSNADDNSVMPRAQLNSDEIESQQNKKDSNTILAISQDKSTDETDDGISTINECLPEAYQNLNRIYNNTWIV